MDAFEVCEDDLSVEGVAVRGCMFDDGVCDLVLVVPSELDTAARALLLVTHGDDSKRPGYSVCVQFMFLSISRPPVRRKRSTSSAANARKTTFNTVV